MECSSCGGPLVEGKSSYRASEEDFCLILDNIPAFQCQRCSKVLFSDETADKILKLVARIKRDSTEITSGKPSINLYDY